MSNTEHTDHPIKSIIESITPPTEQFDYNDFAKFINLYAELNKLPLPTTKSENIVDFISAMDNPEWNSHLDTIIENADDEN